MPARIVKTLIKRALRTAGYELKWLAPDGGRDVTLGTPRQTLAQSYAFLASRGFSPATVIDVGVATGTPELYAAFPDAFLLLVEPLAAFEADLRAILATRRGAYVLAAAGREAGEVTFHKHTYQLEGSSLLSETSGSRADGEQVAVTMVRLDDVVRERGITGPFMLKVDVQGAELDVLEGALLVLQDAEAVTLEVSLFEFLKGAPVLAAVVRSMSDLGFVAYDIIPGWTRPLDEALGQVDIVFVKEKGMFRRDHAYATEEQLKRIIGAGS